MTVPRGSAASAGIVQRCDRAAEIVHHGDESGKTRRDDAAVIDDDRLPGRQPHDEKRHGDAVIEPGRDTASTWRRPATSLDDQAVAIDAGDHAGGVQPIGDRG